MRKHSSGTLMHSRMKIDHAPVVAQKFFAYAIFAPMRVGTPLMDAFCKHPVKSTRARLYGKGSVGGIHCTSGEAPF